MHVCVGEISFVPLLFARCVFISNYNMTTNQTIIPFKHVKSQQLKTHICGHHAARKYSDHVKISIVQPNWVGCFKSRVYYQRIQKMTTYQKRSNKNSANFIRVLTENELKWIKGAKTVLIYSNLQYVIFVEWLWVQVSGDMCEQTAAQKLAQLKFHER